ncbi:MAG: cyanophycinase [Thermaerobacter sp.]|nr:cyanophycinase [Thermaerobacter sp.]
MWAHKHPAAVKTSSMSDVKVAQQSYRSHRSYDLHGWPEGSCRQEPAPRSRHPGSLVIIGGHEDKERPAIILSRVLALAGGAAARIAVVPTASDTPRAAGRPYVEVLSRLGAHTIEVLKLRSRAQAMDPSWPAKLARATAVFFTGGDQLRITSTLGGSWFHRALAARQRAGLVVAGTSAGASMMTDTMIVEGAADQSPTRNTVHLAVGMGLWPGAVVDQHFSERGRIGRLLSAVAQNPAVLGVGIDENTAIEVDFGDRCFKVLGKGTVTVLDGWGAGETNASESRPQEPLALTAVQLHVLAPTWAFRWAERQPVAPSPSFPRRERRS